MIPHISIRYGRFLDPIFTAWVKSQPGKEHIEVPTEEFVKASIKRYRALWDVYGEKILLGIQDITGLTFKRNEIDVFIVALNGTPFSRPIVMKCRYSDEEFINVLAHELIHCLYSDNEKSLKDSYIYPHAHRTTAVHVYLHAILKALFVDVLKEPERIETIKKNCLNPQFSNQAYAEAWDIVESVGYKELIKEFKVKVFF